MENLKTVWDFDERYYPNYSSCDLIAENNDLQVILDAEDLEGSHAYDLKKALIKECAFNYEVIFKKDTALFATEIEEQVMNDVKLKLLESNAYIYEKAIQGFIDEQNK